MQAALTSIYLEGNQIGDLGAQHLAQALQFNFSLTTLGLGVRWGEGNQIGKIGTQYLADRTRPSPN